MSATCAVCAWTNGDLSNVGEPGKPRMVCLGCLKRAVDDVARLRGLLGALRESHGRLLGLAHNQHSRFHSVPSDGHINCGNPSCPFHAAIAAAEKLEGR